MLNAFYILKKKERKKKKIPPRESDQHYSLNRLQTEKPTGTVLPCAREQERFNSTRNLQIIWGFALRCLTRASLCWMPGIIVSMAHTPESQRLILMLLRGASRVQTTHEAICLMQFPTESLTSRCINTLKRAVVTQNNDQPDWEQPHIPQS